MPWNDYPLRTLTLPADAGPSAARIVIGSNIPPELVTFYAGFGYTVDAVILFYEAGGNYQYQALITATFPDGSANMVIGKVSAGVVSEEFFLNGAPGGVLYTQDMFWETATGDVSAGGYNLITPLNGFANRGAGYVRLQWRRVVSPADCVQIVGELNTGVVAGGTVIGNIPAPHRPLSIIPLVVQNSNTPAGRMTVLEFNPNGDLKLFDYGAGVVGINGLYMIGTN
jgi:hypothetical protein